MAEIITQQSGLFLISILYGGFLGIWYDVFRAFRKCRPHRDILVHLEDIFYILSAGVGLFLIFQIFNRGSIRFYVIFGVAAGAGLYFVSLSKVVERVFEFLWQGVLFVLGTSLRCLFYLPKLFVKSLIKSLKKVKRTVKIIKSRK